jgi:hypothetical protein
MVGAQALALSPSRTAQVRTWCPRRAYLAKLIANKQVSRYLQQQQADVLREFEAIVKTVSLDQ